MPSKKINVRSPYYAYKAQTSGTWVYAEWEVRVWSGLSINDKPATANYTFTKNFIDNKINLEVSEIVRDFIEHTNEYSVGDSVKWVRVDGGFYRDTDPAGNPSGSYGLTTIAFDGYGYYEEGINPELSYTKLFSNKVIWRPEDENIRIPVFGYTMLDIVMVSNGEPVRTIQHRYAGGQEDSNEMIQYFSVSGDINADNYKQRVLVEGIYEHNPLLDELDNYVDVNLIDEIRIYQLNASPLYIEAPYEKIEVRTQKCDKYPDHKVTFVNKFGALQDVYFFAKAVESMTSTGEQFKANTYDLATNSYSVTKHQYQQYNKQAKERITLSTGYVSEDYNEVIKQLMMSEYVWLTKTTDESSNIYPVIPRTSDVTFKTSLNDKLVSYDIEFDFAFDKIQNVR